jgi:glycerol-3-phosphate O-acyltransferase
MNDRPLTAYEPNPLLAWVYRHFFETIEVDRSWLDAVREADRRGTVVYVLRNLSLIDLLALDYLTKRNELPRIRFANDLGLWILDPMRSGGVLGALRWRSREGDAADLVRAVSTGASAALFLKRPAHLLERHMRGRIEGDRLLGALLQYQRHSTTPVLFVPQVFVWSRSPGTRGAGTGDALFGPSEWPGNLRTIAQFAANWRFASLRAGEPVDLAKFLEREGAGTSDAVLIRRLTYVLLRRLDRERRTIVGPTRKPADRLREEVIRSPKLQKVIADMAGEGDKEQQVIAERAMEMLRGLEASLDMNAIAALDRLVAAAAARMFSAVEVDVEGIERLRTLAREGTLILLPSHKSHMDYVVLAWVLYRHKMPLPLVAAGDNLNFFPLGPVLRRAGAFFIRRKFQGDRLYSAVVDAYVRRQLREGASFEFFLEGGRSRSGKLLPPKLGLLSLVVDASLSVPTTPTWFCPISIGYERFVEEKAFVREMSGADKQKEDVRGLVKSVEATMGRYGRLSVQFGKPLHLTEVLQEIDPGANPADVLSMTPIRRRAVVTRLAYRVMNEINAVAAVTAGSLVASGLLSHHKRGLPHAELVATAERLARPLRRVGARFSSSVLDASGAIRAEALAEAVDMFVRAGHVERRHVDDEAIYVVPPEARIPLELAKNGIIHFYAARMLVATALLAPPGAPLLLTTVRERVNALSRLFKYEFTFRADAPFERIFDEEVAAMAADGELVLRTEGTTDVFPKGEDGRKQIELYAALLSNFVEGYRVAARGLTALLRGPMPPRELVKRTIGVGEKMFLSGEIGRREAVNQPLLENAYASFVDQSYVARAEGKLSLNASYATANAVATIEARIGAMGPTRS